MMSPVAAVFGAVMLSASMALVSNGEDIPIRVIPKGYFGDDRYTLCCRLPQYAVPERYIPLCSYSRYIDAYTALLEVLRAHPGITSKEVEDAGLAPDALMDLVKLMASFPPDEVGLRIGTALIECGRPEGAVGVEGMGQCCAEEGVADACLYSCTHHLDVGVRSDPDAHRKLMECAASGAVKVAEHIVAGYKCLKETSK